MNMRDLIMLSEAAIKSKYGIVQRNPSPRQLLAFLLNSSRKELRGYIDNTGAYFWDAEKAIHHDMAVSLGLDYSYLNRLHVYIDEENLPEITWCDGGPMDLIKRLINSDQIIVDGGSSGRMTGSEYVSQLEPALAETQELDEIELGGMLDPSFVDDLDKKDLSSDQLDLFEPTTTGQPRLPANMKLMGRSGAYYVAQRTGPLPGQEQSKSEHLYVFVKDNKAAGYICLYPWSKDHVEYPHQAAYQPDLHGNGLRSKAVMVMPEFRGQNLGPTMYKWVLENVCDYIIADTTHTQSGAALWKKMRTMKNVFAVEIWNADKYETQPRWHKHVYGLDYYIPWITLRGREERIRTGEDE